MLEYSVELAPSNVKDGEELTNTATVPSYFGVAETERNEGKETYFKEKIPYRDYDGSLCAADRDGCAAGARGDEDSTRTKRDRLGNKDSYTIIVDNSGTSIAHEVKVVDTLPLGMTYEARRGQRQSGDGFSEESVVGNVVTWKIASIGVAENVEINVPVGIEANVETGSELKNEVAVTSTEQTTPVEAEGPIKITTSADVEAKKSVLGGATTAVPGAGLTYWSRRRTTKGRRRRARCSSSTNCRRALTLRQRLCGLHRRARAR